MAPHCRPRRNRSHPRAARETAPAAALRDGTPSPPHPPPACPLRWWANAGARKPRSPRHPPPHPRLGRAFYPPCHPGSLPTCPLRLSSANHPAKRGRCRTSTAVQGMGACRFVPLSHETYGRACLLCSSAVPGVWSFLRVTLCSLPLYMMSADSCSMLCYTEKAEQAEQHPGPKQHSTQHRKTVRSSADLTKRNQTPTRYTLTIT